MVVIGNGESRIDIDLDRIPSPKIGCNAVVREHFIDSVVCVDRKMVQECLVKHSSNFTNLYTRECWLTQFKKYKVSPVPSIPYHGKERFDDPFQWGSGSYALLLACASSKIVKMIGFDLYGKNKLINNYYKDTENYHSSTKRAVDPRSWMHQISKVFECFPQTRFTIYQTPHWHLPQKWNLPNVEVDKISNFTYN